MRLRQLPQLYLRGSIANETMRYLSDKERDNIDSLTREISSNTLLAGHKYRFIQKLGQTIGGDYKDRQAAEQEFDVAIWRALAYLLHHCDYKYRCEACNSVEYLTGKNKPKMIDRRYQICPSCNMVRIIDSGDSNLNVGQFVDINQIQQIILELGDKVRAPKHTSPIISIKGTKKVLDYTVVLGDPNQLIKYFGEFIWNYFRQILRENEIKYHQKDPYQVRGPADQVAVDVINSLLTQHKIPHHYEPKANPINDIYRISVELMIVNYSISRYLRNIIDTYEKYGVTIKATDTEITINAVDDAQQVEAIITTPQPVCIQGNNDDNMLAFDTDIRSNYGEPTMQEDGIAKIESDDLMANIRDSLNDGAQRVYDIVVGQGATYDEFVEFQRGPNGTRVDMYIEKPCDIHIARFLGVNKRQIEIWKNDIKIQCLANGICNT